MLCVGFTSSKAFDTKPLSQDLILSLKKKIPFQPNQFTPHPFQNKHQETAT